MDIDTPNILTKEEWFINVALSSLLPSKNPSEFNSDKKKRFDAVLNGEKTVFFKFIEGTTILDIINVSKKIHNCVSFFTPFELKLPLVWKGSLASFHQATFGQSENIMDANALNEQPSPISKKYFTEPLSPNQVDSDSLSHLRPFFLSTIEITVEDILKKLNLTVATELPSSLMKYITSSKSNSEEINLSKPEDKEKALAFYKDFTFDSPMIEVISFEDVKSTFPVLCGIKSNCIHLHNEQYAQEFYNGAITSISANATTAIPSTFSHKFPTHNKLFAFFLNPNWINKVTETIRYLHTLVSFPQNQKASLLIKYHYNEFAGLPLNGIITAEYSFFNMRVFVIPHGHWLHCFLESFKEKIKEFIATSDDNISITDEQITETLKTKHPESWVRTFLKENPDFKLSFFGSFELPTFKEEKDNDFNSLSEIQLMTKQLEEEYTKPTIYNFYVRQIQHLEMALKAFIFYAKHFYKANKFVPLNNLGFGLFRMDKSYTDNNLQVHYPWLSDEDFGPNKLEIDEEYELKTQVKIKCTVFPKYDKQESTFWIAKALPELYSLGFIQ